MRISLRQLMVFDAVARLESVSRAGDEIALSQSAVSMSIKELETHLNASLFHRQGKRISLNDYGRWLQPRIKNILSQVEALEHNAFKGQIVGNLKIGASTTIGNYLLPKHIASFVQTNEEVQIELSVNNTEQIVEDMLAMKIDIGFIEGPIQSEKLKIIPWKKDQLKIICHPRHKLAGKKVLVNELAEEKWILREFGSGTREIFSRAVEDVIKPLKVKLELGNSEAIKQAVKTHLGLACLSELVVQTELAHGELSTIEVEGIDLSRKLSRVERLKSEKSYLAKTFLRELDD